MNAVRYYEMRPAQIRAARDQFPVAYLPMGTLEWHGEHNPIGLDAIKATAMAETFAQRIGGLVMPTVWWGDHRGILAEVVFGDHRPGIMAGHGGLSLASFEEDAKRSEDAGGWKLWESLYRRTLYEISTLGFKVIVTISGHYPLSSPAARVAEEFRESDRMRVISIIGCDMVEDLFHDENGKGGDHAAKWETSLLLYLRPELVDLSMLDPDPAVAPVGVMGEDPRRATAEYGQAAMRAMTDALRMRVLDALGALGHQSGRA